MKQFNKTYLPDAITYNGETYKVNSVLSVNMNSNNVALNSLNASLKAQGRKAICVNVLSPNLKGVNDLYGRPYQPTKWIFTND